eukprot:scaffold18932_cov65-Phaeocystis_antarctica.AAC.12
MHTARETRRAPRKCTSRKCTLRSEHTTHDELNVCAPRASTKLGRRRPSIIVPPAPPGAKHMQDAPSGLSAQRATATRLLRAEVKLDTCAQLFEAGSKTSAVPSSPPALFPPKT